jgi:hypothetical protein
VIPTCVPTVRHTCAGALERWWRAKSDTVYTAGQDVLYRAVAARTAIVHDRIIRQLDNHVAWCVARLTQPTAKERP